LDELQAPPEGADRRAPPCNSGAAFAWHIDAVQSPWSGEFVEPVCWRLADEVAAASSPARETTKHSRCTHDTAHIIAKTSIPDYSGCHHNNQ
jgi:hypothetical protein